MIYVYIPCRLDKEVIPTCFDLINKAENPNNIKIIVFNQDRQSDMFFQDLFPPQVTLINVDYRKFSNLCWIRSLAKYFIEPEFKYFLSIDSHMRFDKNWDTILINALLPNSILSAYPPAYPLYGKFEENKTHHANDWNREKIGGYPFVMKPNNNGEDYCKSTIAGGYHFTTIEWLEKVGYDKFLCWRYDEIDPTYRSIGMGYSILNYKHTPIYHLYDRSNRKQDDHAEIFLTDCTERFKSKLNDEYTKKVNEYYDIDFLKYIELY
jgi:hypothetical protein